MQDIKQLMSDTKFYGDYSRWQEDKQRYESWDDAVDRVMNMHKEKYKDKMSTELRDMVEFVSEHYKKKNILGAQRALQFGGEQLMRHNSKLYNCSASYVDRLEFFQEAMYLLLCGCGVGFSVQKEHIKKLPNIYQREFGIKQHIIEDSIEGWSDAFGILLSSFVKEQDAVFKEYSGYKILFDFSKIRPAGAEISGGFKAPGANGLMQSLDKVNSLLESACKTSDTISSICAYDIVMHMADAVLSGGVRRSATICLFSHDDQEMVKAKTGDWFIKNPQRGRSNNSAVLIRDSITRDEFAGFMSSIKEFGEPGFIFADNIDYLTNPCAEIGMRGYTQDGRSGFQMCNLCEINGGNIKTEEDFFTACKAASILGTLQAGYTDFKYLSSATKEIVEHEALLGVSVTGWMNSPDILFNPETLKEGAKIVKETNELVAKLIDINVSARTCCIKPSGNASVVLGTASGIHGEHSKRYIRHVTKNVTEDIVSIFKEHNPSMVETSVWSNNGTDVMIAFPIETKEGSIYKSDLLGVKQLDYVKLAQQYWVMEGKNTNVKQPDYIQHNVSNTITVDNWDEVEQYVWDNKQYFTGISFMSAFGDKAFAQAPFTEVLDVSEIVEKYGVASMFASGLIVDGLKAFDNNLWKACDTLQGFGEDLTEENHNNILKRDWIRRANKFNNNYFNDTIKMISCLKDCYNLHKWNKIMVNFKEIDLQKSLKKKDFVAVDTIAGAACSGGVCEIIF